MTFTISDSGNRNPYLNNAKFYLCTFTASKVTKFVQDSLHLRLNEFEFSFQAMRVILLTIALTLSSEWNSKSLFI